jgi:hypothetical protein
MLKSRGRPKDTEKHLTKAYAIRKQDVLNSIEQINKSFADANIIKLVDTHEKKWTNPSLILNNESIYENAPPEKDIQIVGMMDIKTFMEILNKNIVTINPLNRRGGSGGLNYSTKTAKQVETKFEVGSLGVIHLKMPKNKNEPIIILDGNSRVVGLKRLWAKDAFKDKNFDMCILLKHPDAPTKHYFDLNNQAAHQLGDFMSHPDHSLGKACERIRSASKIPLNEANTRILLDILIAYNEDFHGQGKDPVTMLYAARKIVQEIKKDNSCQIHEKSFKAVEEAFNYYVDFITALGKKATVSAQNIIKDKGVMTVFLQDYLYDGYVRKASIKTLVNNCDYNDHLKQDRHVLSIAIASAGLIAKKPTKKAAINGYLNTIHMLKGEKYKLVKLKDSDLI